MPNNLQVATKPRYRRITLRREGCRVVKRKGGGPRGSERSTSRGCEDEEERWRAAGEEFGEKLEAASPDVTEKDGSVDGS